MYEAERYYATVGTNLMEVVGGIYEGKAVTAAMGTITFLERKANQGLKQDCLAASSHFNVYINSVICA
jgi:hypothetical protein